MWSLKLIFGALLIQSRAATQDKKFTTGYSATFANPSASDITVTDPEFARSHLTEYSFPDLTTEPSALPTKSSDKTQATTKSTTITVSAIDRYNRGARFYNKKIMRKR